MKISSKILIVDGSMLIHRNLKVPQLFELVNKKGERTGGIFGFLNSLQSTLKKFPDYYPIVTWDSGLSPTRLKIYPNYKKHLDKIASSIVDGTKDIEKYKSSDTYDELQESINMIMQDRSNWTDFDRDSHNESREESKEYVAEYHRQRDILIQILSSIGIPSIKYANWEGDDLMTLLKRMSGDRAIVMTDDKDLIQLIDTNTDIWRPIQNQYLEFDSYMAKNNYDSYREMIFHKAIVGDGSDNIPAVTAGLERKYSLGSTRAKVVAKIIYESHEDKETYLQVLKDFNKNYYKGFIDNVDIYERNMKLVDLDLVPDDKDIIFNIIEDINKVVGRCDFFTLTGLLKELEINSLDANFLVSSMSRLSRNFKIGD